MPSQALVGLWLGGEGSDLVQNTPLLIQGCLFKWAGMGLGETTQFLISVYLNCWDPQVLEKTSRYMQN